MKKIVLLLWGIAGVVVVVMLCIWVFRAGTGLLRENFPQWVDGGKKMVSEGISKVDKVLPGVKETAEGIVPQLTAKVQEIIPGAEIPAKDVDGEDIKPIPRSPDLIRISYATDNGKKIVSYKGKMKLEAASEFYKKEMAALGFNEKVVSASLEEAVYHYTKGTQVVEFRFKKTATIPSEITELTIKEL
jgi:hypothetical protein